MYRSIHFDTDQLLVNHPEYLRKHDVVYYSPPYRGFDGLPVGNGDLGGMVWNTDRSVEIGLNKMDLIDFGADGRFKAWAWESEERNTAQVSGGRLSISDGMPSFDRFYLQEYETRLNLGEGRLTMRSQTPFSEWNTKVFASSDFQTLVVRMKACSPEAVERRIRLERWGSRSFFHYYEQLVNDPTVRIGETRAGSLRDCPYIRQDLRRTSFVTCAKLIGVEYHTHIANTHTVELVVGPQTEVEATLLVTIVAGGPEDDLAGAAVKLLETAALELEEVERRHQESWRLFWIKSFIQIEDDYIENLYYLNLYQLQSCSRGRYPLSFGGLWAWHGDSRNWGHFYHWNHQQTYWGTQTAGHPELAENYYRYRFGMLENARRDARELFKVKGAFFSDISNYNGYQAIEPDTIINYTCGPQIAMDFYRHYQYTGDLRFLKEQVYPMMKACADFYSAILEQSEGVYHIRNGATAYESYWNLKDTITDYAEIRVLFLSVIEVAHKLKVDSDWVPKWREILDHLFEAPLTEVMNEAGERLIIFAAGIKWDGGPVEFNEGDYPRSPFVACQLAPIFPSGLIGLKDQGSERFTIAWNTARWLFDYEVYENGKMGCSGHTPSPEVAARLGMKEDAARILSLFAEKYQVFPNGFTHYLEIPDDGNYCGLYVPRVLKGDEEFTQWEYVHEKSHGERIRVDSERFIHMYFEPLANIMCGVNEMLLQSYDGVIRVFPAVSERDSAIFSLAACGGFQVTAEKKGAEIPYIHVRSKLGGVCRVELPWIVDSPVVAPPVAPSVAPLCKTAIAFQKNGNESQDFGIKDGIIEFETSVGDGIMIHRRNFGLENYYLEKIRAEVNQRVKKKGRRVIGRERDF